MATYKGIGYETSTGRTRTGTSSDDISFDAKVTATDGVDVTGVGLTVTAGGVDVQAGGLSVDAGGASIVGNTSISGNLTVTGTLISQDEQQVLVKDNFLDLNFGYVGTSYEQTGMTFNYQATSAGVSIDTTGNTLTFTAGTTTARAKVEAATTSGIPADTFADGDIVQINGTTNADNDGIYVVHANSSAGTVEFKSNTLTSPDTVNAAFALLDVTAETESTSTAVTIRKVNLLALRASSSGTLESAQGAVDSDFSSYGGVGASTLQEAYDAGNTITTDASGAITFTLSDDAQGLSVQGASGGTGSVSIGGTTAVDSFVVGASGAASSITSTGQNLTLQTATSGQVVLRSAGIMTVDSDDSLTIQMDADNGSPKRVFIQANNAGGGDAMIDLDADNEIGLQIAGAGVLTLTSALVTSAELVQLSDDSAKGLRFGASGQRVDAIYDQDDMSADDANGLATQQSIKAYVDNTVEAYQAISQLTDGSGGAISAGDVVAINASGQAIQADADAESTCRVIGICASVDGSDIYVQQVGNITGLSGLTAGDRLYASTTAGALTSTPPSAAGDIVFQVGYATSTSAMILAPSFIMEIG